MAVEQSRHFDVCTTAAFAKTSLTRGNITFRMGSESFQQFSDIILWMLFSNTTGLRLLIDPRGLLGFCSATSVLSIVDKSGRTVHDLNQVNLLTSHFESQLAPDKVTSLVQHQRTLHNPISHEKVQTATAKLKTIEHVAQI